MESILFLQYNKKIQGLLDEGHHGALKFENEMNGVYYENSDVYDDDDEPHRRKQYFENASSIDIVQPLDNSSVDGSSIDRLNGSSIDRSNATPSTDIKVFEFRGNNSTIEIKFKSK